MASTTSGLTRRRGGGTVNTTDDNVDGRVSSPVPKRTDDRTPETSYENSANGHKIAFDPRDISESAERNKQPKLTLMEEVILMGLKDKQVRIFLDGCPRKKKNRTNSMVRAIFRFGTTTYPMLFEAALS